MGAASSCCCSEPIVRCHRCADAASRPWRGGSRQSAQQPADSARERVRQPVSEGTGGGHRRTPQVRHGGSTNPVKPNMNGSRHSPMGLRWLSTRADCCGKTPKALGKNPGGWGKPPIHQHSLSALISQDLGRDETGGQLQIVLFFHGGVLDYRLPAWPPVSPGQPVQLDWRRVRGPSGWSAGG